LAESTSSAGEAFSTTYLGRGAAFLDFDNDGKVDVIVANSGDPPLLLHNTGAGANFLSLKLVGTRSNRDALGARIAVTAGGTSQIREVAAGGSYLSQSDLRAHFGLGSAGRVEKIAIVWPSGAKQVFQDVAVNQFLVATEGASSLAPAVTRREQQGARH
jgi:hypothetical protein